MINVWNIFSSRVHTLELVGIYAAHAKEWQIFHALSKPPRELRRHSTLHKNIECSRKLSATQYSPYYCELFHASKKFKKDLQIELAPFCHNYESINHVHHVLIYLILELCGIPISFQNFVDYSILEIIGSFSEHAGLRIS